MLARLGGVGAAGTREDALFSAFLHVYSQTNDPYETLRQAQVFASWKIGATGAADGFLDAAGLAALMQTVRS